MFHCFDANIVPRSYFDAQNFDILENYSKRGNVLFAVIIKTATFSEANLAS